jgi:hypothetical protein
VKETVKKQLKKRIIREQAVTFIFFCAKSLRRMKTCAIIHTDMQAPPGGENREGIE